MSGPPSVDGIRHLSAEARRHLPDHIAHQHIADAAHALGLGLHDGSVRHLRAAADSLAPRQLRRLGIADDESHAKAARLVAGITQHALLVREEQDAEEGPAPAPAAAAAAEMAGTRHAVELAAAVREQAGL